MKKYYFILVALSAVMLFSGAAFADGETPVGKIKTLKGVVVAVRGGKVLPLKIGDSFYRHDTIRTGASSSVGMICDDDTVLSLGSQSEILVSEYIFEPHKGLYAMVADILKGTASYLSGIIGKQSPQSVRINTPDATIGIRGTHLLIKVDGVR